MNDIARLHNILSQNRPLYDVIVKMAGFGLPNYYIGAGCIAQTVWNHLCGLELMHGISDIDIAYYDATDLSANAENAVRQRIMHAIEPCTIEVDINNQARVHQWYKGSFGYDIAPYTSVEDGISTWPTTATAVGVRLKGNELEVYAPFGLDDLFGMVVRANKVQITEEIYMKKVQKWLRKWPQLAVVPW